MYTTTSMKANLTSLRSDRKPARRIWLPEYVFVDGIDQPPPFTDLSPDKFGASHKLGAHRIKKDRDPSLMTACSCKLLQGYDEQSLVSQETR